METPATGVYWEIWRSADLLLPRSSYVQRDVWRDDDHRACPLVAKSTMVSAVDSSKTISVVLALPSSDPAGLKAFVDHVSTPGDPLYRQFITPQEFATRFGANASDYEFLKTWAGSNNLTISQESVGRTTLTVRGSVATLNRLFKTEINNYKTSNGTVFYSAGVKPSIPAEIGSKVVAVVGLTSAAPNAALAKKARPSVNTRQPTLRLSHPA